MATTIAELEQRLRKLETEVAALHEVVVNGSLPTPSSATSRAQRSQSPPSSVAGEASLDAVYQEMGISGEAPGIEQLRNLLAAHGVYPGDDVVRQEIAAMRDQEEKPDE
jgi:hypothetical protein